MQRLDLVPASQLLPNPTFFIPFSSSSPFAAPPLPESFDIPSVAGWVGKLVVNLAPFATFYICGCVWQSTCAALKSYIRKRLPRPWFTLPPPSRSSGSTGTTQRQAIPESPTLGTTDRDIRHQVPETDAPTSLALDGETVPVGRVLMLPRAEASRY